MARMQWSKLRSGVESCFADSVKGRARLFSTRYRTTHDQDGRAWITLDGREIVNMPHLWTWLRDRDERALQLAAAASTFQEMRDTADIALMNEGKFMQPYLGTAMHEYLSMSMTEILEAGNPVIRAIGMLDRRFGRRRRECFDSAREHALVRELYEFRMLAETQWRVRDRRQVAASKRA